MAERFIKFALIIKILRAILFEFVIVFPCYSAAIYSLISVGCKQKF